MLRSTDKILKDMRYHIESIVNPSFLIQTYQSKYREKVDRMMDIIADFDEEKINQFRVSLIQSPADDIFDIFIDECVIAMAVSKYLNGQYDASIALCLEYDDIADSVESAYISNFLLANIYYRKRNLPVVKHYLLEALQFADIEKSRKICLKCLKRTEIRMRETTKLPKLISLPMHFPLKEQECSICRENLIVSKNDCATTSCFHVFHKVCVQAHIQEHGTCPYCRMHL